jgi:hypothetical protein
MNQTRTLVLGAAIALWMSMLTPSSALSQDEIPTKVTNQNRTGSLPFSTSIGMDIEQVDFGSGNLILHVPIAMVKGRGMDFNFVLNYDALGLVVGTRSSSTGPYQLWNIEDEGWLVTSGFGWRTNAPRTTSADTIYYCVSHPDAAYYQRYFIYQDSNGAKHPLTVQVGGASLCSNGFADDPNPDLTGAGWLGHQSGDVSLPDGTGASSSNWVDINGNIKNEYPGGLDTVGRTIVTQQNLGNQILYTVRDPNASAQTYTVNLSNISIATNFNINGPYGRILEYSGTRTVISSIVLPNGRSYLFQYENNGYGAINRIDLPTGGFITYTWATAVDSDKSHRYVAARTVNVNGQSYTWSFSRTGSNDNIVVTATDTLQNQAIFNVVSGAVESANFYNGAASGNPYRQYNMVYDHDYYNPWAIDRFCPDSCRKAKGVCS